MSHPHIKTVDELGRLVAGQKEQGRIVVHCHGVFDLLHIGHIKHLEAARKLGDLLVVTLTPDRFVNKGPHRPAFPEQLRAEALAALSCVDWVSINEWPTAVETLRLLKPSIYVKGGEYRDASRDVTGKIAEEESAVRESGGRIAYTDDITFSSSRLINQHMSPYAEVVKDYVAGLAKRHSMEDIVNYVRLSRGLKVLVVGEAIIDEYQYCAAIGKSSKEPTLVVKMLSSEKFAGGILALGNHVAGFCDRVTVLTMLGAQHSQEAFIRSHMKENVEKVFLVRQDAPTIVKRRLIEQYFFMKIMEVYEINDLELSEADNANFCKALEEQVARHDVVIVVDYGHGLLSRDAIDILTSKSKFLAVNAQSNAGNLGYHTISMYPRADYITMTEGEARLEARNRSGELRKIVADVAGKVRCERVIVTRGKNGCLCYDAKQGFFEIPAIAGKVVDRIGAGDAFLSISALCAAQGTPIELAGFVGSAAAAQAVATVGNKDPVDRVALLKQIETLMK